MNKKASNNTVLIVEDDDTIAYLLEFLLSREGMQVVAATDGQKAHDLIEEIKPPNLVLLDVMLPFINGFELIKHIRSLSDWENVPVIMLSSKSHEKDIIKALDSGANDYVVKPFQPLELIARINRYL